MDNINIPNNAVNVKPVAVSATVTVGFFSEDGHCVGMIPITGPPVHFPFGLSVEDLVNQIVNQLKEKMNAGK